MSWLDKILRRNSELEFMFDLDLAPDMSKRIHMKKLAIDTCINFLGRTISQSDFRIRNGKEFIKDELFYRLNVRPNKNQNASMFWQSIIYKLIYDNECLVVKSDDDDLLIADDFHRDKYAIFEDRYVNVVVEGYEFRRSFPESKVFYLQYNNESLKPLIDGLFDDYGELFGRVLSAQKRKNQIRSTVSVDAINMKDENSTKKLQDFIDKIYKAIHERDVAVVPQQKGYEYTEHQSTPSGGGQTVDEINKVTDGFLDQVAIAIGIPPGILHGEMSDINNQLKTYMTFTVGSLVTKIEDEANGKFFTQEDFLNGMHLDVRKVSYQDIFEIATAIDKLISSGGFSPNEMRDAAGWEREDDERLDKHYITKNYSEMIEGGEED